MKIANPKAAFIDRAQAIAELEQLLQAIASPLDQPCPHCLHPEQAGDSEHCHWQCPGAAQALSSEASHPIEAHVQQIVFELTKLGLFQPCWSCEGHAEAETQLRNRPQVVFYCANAVYALLLHEHIDLLFHGGHLHCPWQITLTSLGQKLGVTYTLEPSQAEQTSVTLATLQEDLAVIGENLARHLQLITEARLSSLKMEQATLSAYHYQRL